MTEVKKFWVTELNSEETSTGDIYQLAQDISKSFRIPLAEAAEILQNLEEDETIQFTKNGRLYEVDIELIESSESEENEPII